MSDQKAQFVVVSEQDRWKFRRKGAFGATVARHGPICVRPNVKKANT